MDVSSNVAEAAKLTVVTVRDHRLCISFFLSFCFDGLCQMNET